MIDKPTKKSSDIILATGFSRWIEMQLEGQKIKKAILTALADPEMVSIINSTIYQSKSVYDIIMETKMPHTTAYRKIKWLVEQDLLVVDKICITDEGKKYSLFRSVFRSIVVKYENIKIMIEAEQNIDPVNRLTERFFSLWVDKVKHIMISLAKLLEDWGKAFYDFMARPVRVVKSHEHNWGKKNHRNYMYLHAKFV
jgi:DNA-binding transcriptional ArsR family regulator